jgi:hypothetical protein
VRRPMFIWNFCGLAGQRRMLDADGLAEGEEPGSNVLRTASVAGLETAGWQADDVCLGGDP